MLTIGIWIGVLAYFAVGARIGWDKMWADFAKLGSDFGDAAGLAFVLLIFSLGWPVFAGLAWSGYLLRALAIRRERKSGWFSQDGTLHQTRRVA